MTYLDVVLALPLVWGIYRGFTKGFIISIATLAALILGIYSAIHFSSSFSSYVQSWFHPQPQYLQVLTFAIIFLVVVLIIRLLGWFLDRMIKAVSLGFVNRLLGVLLNVIKWAFIVSVAISIFEGGARTRNLISEQTKEESILYRPMSAIAPFVFPYLKFDKLKDKIQGSSTVSVKDEQIWSQFSKIFN